jgi:hypothetical protein
MRFLRVYAQQGLHGCWLEQQPPLARLLKCFDIKREATRPPEPTSVFLVNDEGEELEVVTALAQTTPSSPEKRFGILVSDEDCRAAGIRIDRDEPGQTGVSVVDIRHANLIGDQNQVFQLMVQIVASLWTGQQRLRVYPAQAILGQLAIFRRWPDASIHPQARANCERMLSLVSDEPSLLADPPRMQVRGQLQDSQGALPVHAERLLGSTVSSISWWKRLWQRIVPGRWGR